MNQNPYYNPRQNTPPTPPQGSYYQPPVYQQPPYGNPYYQQPNLSPQYAEQMRRAQALKNKRNQERNELLLKGVVIGAALILMLIIEVIATSVLQAAGLFDLLETNATFANCFNILAVHICALGISFTLLWLLMKKKAVQPLIPTEKIGKLKAFMWVCFGMGCCMAANYITEFVIQLYNLFGYELTQPEYPSADSWMASVALIFSTAVVPAIFEEYAMRCATLGVLKKHGKAFGVVAVSIVFGLIHGNMIQFVFAFCVGLALGYITVKTNNVIPAMLVHGFNNGISVIQEILEFSSGEDMATNVSTAIIIGWIVLAIIGIIYLIVKKELFTREPKAPKTEYDLTFCGKLLCLCPGFAIPFFILIMGTFSYITPTPSIPKQIAISLLISAVTPLVLFLISYIEKQSVRSRIQRTAMYQQNSYGK